MSNPGIIAKLRAKLSFGKRISQKQRQWINLGVGFVLFIAAALVVSSMMGSPEQSPAAVSAQQKLVDSVPLIVPGEPVNDRDRWLGKAGESVAKLQDKLNEQNRINDELLRRLGVLEQGRNSSPALTPIPAQPAAGTSAPNESNPAAGASPAPQSAPASQAVSTAPAPRASNNVETFPPTRGGNVEAAKKLPASGGATVGAGMPPATPNTVTAGQGPAPIVDEGTKLVRVALNEGGKGVGKDAALKDSGGESDKAKSHHVGTYLPVSFARIRLIGGIDAPTGGQAQSNPLPVFLKIEDNAFLPNNFRSKVKNCFVVGAAYGDISSERGYIRSETLSCVTRSGQSIEVPLKGVVYGEDGKLGLRGTVATKQGQILANAAAAGIASGIGQGFSTKYTTFATTPYGTAETIDNEKVLQAGLATGFGSAMDRLAKYWIGVAEKMFPVIEIDASRVGDLFITKGTLLDFPIDEIGGSSMPDTRGRINRTAMLNKGSDDDDN